MRRRHPARRLVAPLLAVGLVVASPGPALAGPRAAGGERRGAEAPEALRARCLQAIAVRLSALGDVSARLAGAPLVGEAHRRALSTQLAAATSALSALQEEIRSDADRTSLAADCRSVFRDQRILALVVPRARLVIVADRVGALAGRLSEVADALERAIGRRGAEGRDTSRAEADLTALRAELAAGPVAASGVADHLLGLTAAGWIADHQILRPDRQLLGDARADLGEARALARRIVTELRRGA